jgi:23S rRNA (pseudouridine1915-N3)-methyltransferase
MKLHILAVGKLRGPEAELCADYAKRLSHDITIKEITTGTQAHECAALLGALPDKGLIVALDERGKDLTSRDFAMKFASWVESAPGTISFIIGGADGLSDALRHRADYLLCFGRLTWPHKLVRVLLLEQLYRAETILSGHPYHRD